MSDIELVIKIPEEEYNIIKKSNAPMYWVEHLIKKGVPLQKGHGDLIDRKALLNAPYEKGDFVEWDDEIKDAQAIIEADKEENKVEEMSNEKAMNEYKNGFDSEYILKVQEQLRETEEEFAYALISPFCESIVEKRLSKKELERILRKGMQAENVLNKIRAEIEGKYRVIFKDTPKDDWAVRWNQCIDEVLQVIDKYNSESEKKE